MAVRAYQFTLGDLFHYGCKPFLESTDPTDREELLTTNVIELHAFRMEMSTTVHAWFVFLLI